MKLHAAKVAVSFHWISSRAVNSTIFLKPLSKEIPGKKLEFFWPTHHKMLSNFTNIRHLVYQKCIIWGKLDLLIINLVWEKVWFTISGLSKMLFLTFVFFIFWSWKWPLPKIFWKTHPFLIGFEDFNEVPLSNKYFWST